MESQIDRKSVFSGLIWRFAERSGAQGVTLIVSIILARLLEPSDYGVVALITAFITILNVFVDSGLGNALIQKKDADELDFSTVFFANFFICLFLYVSVFIVAPYISGFYGVRSLTEVIRVLGLTIVIAGLKNVQQAYVSKNFLFKKFFFATLSGTVGAAILGIIMAFMGCGVWALVAQQLFNSFLDTIVLWVIVKWRPRFLFSFERLKKLFGYGWKLLISSLLETISTELRTLLIGKLYSSYDLAFYNQGQKFPSVIVTNINVSIDSVMFPAISSVQADKVQVKSMVRRAMKISTYIMAPLMMGLAAASETIVNLLLTDKWMPCVFYLRIFCVVFMFYPVHTANLNAIKALGRSDIILKLQIIKKIIEFSLLVVSLQISIQALALSALVSCIIGQIINSWPNRKLLDYGYLEQLKDIMPSILLASLMGLVVYSLGIFSISAIVSLFCQILIGFIVYVCGSVIFKMESFYYLSGILKSAVKK